MVYSLCYACMLCLPLQTTCSTHTQQQDSMAERQTLAQQQRLDLLCPVSVNTHTHPPTHTLTLPELQPHPKADGLVQPLQQLRVTRRLQRLWVQQTGQEEVGNKGVLGVAPASASLSTKKLLVAFPHPHAHTNTGPTFPPLNPPSNHTCRLTLTHTSTPTAPSTKHDKENAPPPHTHHTPSPPSPPHLVHCLHGCLCRCPLLECCHCCLMCLEQCGVLPLLHLAGVDEVRAAHVGTVVLVACAQHHHNHTCMGRKKHRVLC